MCLMDIHTTRCEGIYATRQTLSNRSSEDSSLSVVCARACCKDEVYAGPVLGRQARRYRVTSLITNHLPLGPYLRPMPRV